MTPLPSTFGAAVAINFKLLVAFACGCTSWMVWPESAEWWAFGVLSILMALAAVAGCIQAIKMMVQVHGHEKHVREYMAQGAAPKSSEMASSEHLKKAGMR